MDTCHSLGCVRCTWAEGEEAAAPGKRKAADGPMQRRETSACRPAITSVQAQGFHSCHLHVRNKQLVGLSAE